VSRVSEFVTTGEDYAFNSHEMERRNERCTIRLDDRTKQNSGAISTIPIKKFDHFQRTASSVSIDIQSPVERSLLSRMQCIQNSKRTFMIAGSEAIVRREVALKERRAAKAAAEAIILFPGSFLCVAPSNEGWSRRSPISFRRSSPRYFCAVLQVR
jgi:hypothetical protein